MIIIRPTVTKQAKYTGYASKYILQTKALSQFISIINFCNFNFDQVTFKPTDIFIVSMDIINIPLTSCLSNDFLFNSIQT